MGCSSLSPPPPPALLPFSPKSKSTRTSSTSTGQKLWGMGFLLVFFPEDDFSKKKLSSSSPSPSSLISPPPSPANTTNNKPSIRRTNSSSSNLILTRAQSTISICALLVFITLLLFTLSTFEPAPVHNAAASVAVSFSSRRHLSGRPASRFPNSTPSSSPWAVSNLWQSHQNTKSLAGSSLPSHAHALQRMGTLFLRGTKSMSDLIVVHLLEDDSLDQVRVFLRLFLHSSGLASKSDVVFVFPHQSTDSSSSFNSLIQEECDAFVELVTRYREQLKESAAVPSSEGFDVSQFMRRNGNDGGNNKRKKKEMVRGEPIWGKKSSNNYNNKGGGANNSSVAGESESEDELNYGSVVSFDSGELDPENSLAGFFDQVPMSLRRWACYPMLLGRVRRSYKHVMLVELRSYLIVGDPLVRVRNRSPEAVVITTGRRKNSDRVNAGIIMGGSRGIRRLSSAMVTEIVRAGMQQQQHHKGKKHPVTETSVFNQMVRNELVLKDSVNVVTWGESTPETSSVINSSRSLAEQSRHGVVQRGGNNSEELEMNSIIMQKICGSSIESWVYRDCKK